MSAGLKYKNASSSFFLQVLDNWISVGRYCGSSQPPVITASSDILEIRFVSDGNTSGRGFTAYFTAYSGKDEILSPF